MCINTSIQTTSSNTHIVMEHNNDVAAIEIPKGSKSLPITGMIKCLFRLINIKINRRTK